MKFYSPAHNISVCMQCLCSSGCCKCMHSEGHGWSEGVARGCNMQHEFLVLQSYLQDQVGCAPGRAQIGNDLQTIMNGTYKLPSDVSCKRCILQVAGASPTALPGQGSCLKTLHFSHSAGSSCPVTPSRSESGVGALGFGSLFSPAVCGRCISKHKSCFLGARARAGFVSQIWGLR